MPSETRLLIYGFVVGVGLRILINIDMEGVFDVQSSSEAEWNDIFWIGRKGNHRLQDHHIGVVSYDSQTAIVTLEHQRIPPLDESSAKWAQDLRLLRTCRQIYYEARSVLYQSNTFVFLSFPTFSDYIGLVAPSSIDKSCFKVSRSTEPDRLRAIHAMKKIEIHGIVDGIDFLWASRLIRAGLGCLTSLTSLKLNLKTTDCISSQQTWMIDDSMFSKSTSMEKLLIDVKMFGRFEWTVGSLEWRMIQEQARLISLKLVHQISKQEGFSDVARSFWSWDEIKDFPRFSLMSS